MLYKAIRKKDIKVNGKRCEISTRLQEGDVLTMYLKDEFFAQAPKEYDFLKAPLKLNIIYEDENIMILDKKPGLIVHPDEHYHFDSLITRVQHYLYENGEYDPEAENSFAPALINRIDRNTGGIVMAAKNAETLRIMNQKVKDREMDKLYLCVVCGVPKKKTDILTGYLEKNESQNRVYISNKKTPESRSIRTKYTVLETRRDFSLLARTRSARIWRPSATRLRATANTAKTCKTKRRASRIRRFIPISSSSALRPRPAC